MSIKFQLGLKTVKIWVIGAFAGVLLSSILLFSTQDAPARIINVLYILPTKVAVGDLFLRTFLKNSFASFTIIFLGLFLCFLELQIYTKVSSKTYDFLEMLTNPLYKVLRKFFSPFNEIQPFYRSCFFYLNFVPGLAMFLNGLVFGFLFFYYLSENLAMEFIVSLYPHATLELPAMFLSAFLAFHILEELRNPIFKADLKDLETKIKNMIKNRFVLFLTLFIQAVLIIAARLETS
jgi:uncharacterized protein YggT (Ycf19 family)